MWLCTKLGFYSIVRKGREFNLRARTREDLQRLLQVSHTRAKIIETPLADYRWRVVFHEHWKMDRILVALSDSVDYPNFKSEILRSPGQAEKHSAYSNLWRDLQRQKYGNESISKE